MEDFVHIKSLKMADFHDIKSMKLEDFHKSLNMLKIEEFLDLNS